MAVRGYKVFNEVLDIVNAGHDNTGIGNTGDGNTGNWNAGDWNTGNGNTGDRNAGDGNTGSRNTGDWNAGSRNAGDRNTGDRNAGDGNTGNRNTGNGNTGDRNAGDGNTGDWNTGDWNTGNWNAGDSCTGDFNTCDNETGCFCTKERPVRLFDKESDMTLVQWRNSKAYALLRRISFCPTEWVFASDMTDEEKEAHPEYEATGGYLKTNDLTQAYGEWWNRLDDEEKEVIKKIPNFDPEKFKAITGIRV